MAKKQKSPETTAKKDSAAQRLVIICLLFDLARFQPPFDRGLQKFAVSSLFQVFTGFQNSGQSF